MPHLCSMLTVPTNTHLCTLETCHSPCLFVPSGQTLLAARAHAAAEPFEMLLSANPFGTSMDWVDSVFGTPNKHRLTLQVMQVHSPEAREGRPFNLSVHSR